MTLDKVGRYNHFNKGGSIYWSPRTGAHAMYGAIRRQWAVLGWERSHLGYPTTGEFDIPGGRRNNFLHGYIELNSRTGVTIDRSYRTGRDARASDARSAAVTLDVMNSFPTYLSGAIL
jgi:uncharacterized protein with LGFP repeats